MDIKKLAKNLLFIDIETVSGESCFENLSERYQKLWKHKASFLKNDSNLTIDEQYFDRAAIYAEFGKIVTIGVGFFYWNEANETCLKVKTISADSEKELLLEFKSLVDQRYKNKDLALCAHNGKEFDFPYLCRRMIVNDIALPKSLDFSSKKPWEVPHFDTLEMWKFGDRKQFTSLEMLATLFNIESSKTEMSGDEVNHTYYIENNLNKIREYCLEDIIALAQIFLKLNSLNTIENTNIERLT